MWQAVPVAAQRLFDGVGVLRPLALDQELTRRDEQRGSAAQPDAPVHLLGQPRQRTKLAPRLGVGQVQLDPPGVFLPQRPAVGPDETLVDARVPDVDGTTLSQVEHRLAVGAHAGDHDGPSRRRVEAAVASGHLEAGGQALHVPLPRPGERLVEVVDVEDEAALRRLEEAEVHQMGVATELARQMLQLMHAYPADAADYIWSAEFMPDYRESEAQRAEGSEAPAHLRAILGWFETVGTLHRHGLLNEDLLFDWLAVDASWERVKGHALAWREEMGNVHMYENFEAMADAQVKWSARRDAAAA